MTRAKTSDLVKSPRARSSRAMTASPTTLSDAAVESIIPIDILCSLEKTDLISGPYSSMSGTKTAMSVILRDGSCARLCRMLA